MNDRLCELARGAKLGGVDFGDGIRYWVGTDETFSQFARLIVEECARIVEEDGSAVLPLVIKRHFGVES